MWQTCPGVTVTSRSLRGYQSRGLERVETHWSAGQRSVCFVLPTGGGKSRCAAELVIRAVSRGERALAIAHRTELIVQLADEFRSNGVRYVGLISPNHAPSPCAPVQVASTQTLLARDHRPPADLLIPDEFHHYSAELWGTLISDYPEARICGFTATPVFDGGRSMKGLVDALVVGASYSELIAGGHLLPCKVFQPPERLRKDLALDPVIAYQRYCPGQQTFVFCTTVAQAEAVGAAFTAAGIPAAVVSGKTSGGRRREAITAFEAGRIQVLVNAFLLTEGINITCASAVILARKCGDVGTFLQICGRILRPHPGQTFATLVDLTGASLKHGLPTEDRDYSLEGGIRRLSVDQGRFCPKCGMLVSDGVRVCDNTEPTTGEPCGFQWVPGVRTPPKFLSMELREVYAGSETPEPAKRREWERLLSKGTLAQAAVRFRETFGHPSPYVTELPEPVRKAEYRRLLKVGRIKGYSDGWVAHQFKAAVGAFPPWAWARESLDVD